MLRARHKSNSRKLAICRYLIEYVLHRQNFGVCCCIRLPKDVCRSWLHRALRMRKLITAALSHFDLRTHASSKDKEERTSLLGAGPVLTPA